MHNITRRRALALAAISAGVTSLRAEVLATAPLEIGVLPNISARALMAQYQPMREFLERELKRSVQVSTAPNWVAFHQRTMADEYDIVITASHVARLAQVERRYIPILVYVPDINKTFSGTVTVVNDNTLTGKGCLIGGIGCKSQTWTRVK